MAKFEEPIKVQRFFDRHAQGFDAIYSGKKNLFSRFLDRLLRYDMYERFRRTIAEVGDVRGKRILDIGCGSGRYCAECGRRGAAKVVGIDFAPRMLELAKAVAEQAGAGDVCEFVQGDFMELGYEEPFDFALALGLFDYVKEPEPLLRKIRGLITDRMVATFPIRWTYRAPIRRVRLGLLGCPVYFYTPEGIARLLSRAGFAQWSIDPIGTIYFVTARVSP